MMTDFLGDTSSTSGMVTTWTQITGKIYISQSQTVKKVAWVRKTTTSRRDGAGEL
ncbi:MAG: hypothetical protein ACLUYZ_06570 [Lachnospiraceae bacterium]